MTHIVTDTYCVASVWSAFYSARLRKDKEISECQVSTCICLHRLDRVEFEVRHGGLVERCHMIGQNFDHLLFLEMLLKQQLSADLQVHVTNMLSCFVGVKFG